MNNKFYLQKKYDDADTAIIDISRQQGTLTSAIEKNLSDIAATKTKISQSSVNVKEHLKLENFDKLSTSLVDKLNKYLSNHEAKSLSEIKNLVQKNIDVSSWYPSLHYTSLQKNKDFKNSILIEDLSVYFNNLVSTDRNELTGKQPDCGTVENMDNLSRAVPGAYGILR